MNRLDVGRAIHGYQPPEEKAVLDFETPLGRAKIVRDHWHAPGRYKAFVNGQAVEPSGFPSFEMAKQALKLSLEHRKAERMSFLRKRLALEQKALSALKVFESNFE